MWPWGSWVQVPSSTPKQDTVFDAFAYHNRCPIFQNKEYSIPVIKGLEWTFDTVASEYEKLRPGYPDDLFKAIFDYVPSAKSCFAVEVGIGGGQATEPVLKAGCTVTAVEMGERVSAICREKFKEYPSFSVVTGRFEDIEFSQDTCDLVYSASAFHWIPEEIGYTKVFAMLKHGGAFARFANHPSYDRSRPKLFEDIQSLYATYMNYTAPPAEYGIENARQRAKVALKYGFEDIRYFLF